MYTSMLLVHCLGNFLSVRPVDQHTATGSDILFYFRHCIMEPGVGLLARRIQLAITVLLKSQITHYSLGPIVLRSDFSCMD